MKSSLTLLFYNLHPILSTSTAIFSFAHLDTDNSLISTPVIIPTIFIADGCSFKNLSYIMPSLSSSIASHATQRKAQAFIMPTTPYTVHTPPSVHPGNFLSLPRFLHCRHQRWLLSHSLNIHATGMPPPQFLLFILKQMSPTPIFTDLFLHLQIFAQMPPSQ